jgi:hypothetical protein
MTNWPHHSLSFNSVRRQKGLVLAHKPLAKSLRLFEAAFMQSRKAFLASLSSTLIR